MFAAGLLLLSIATPTDVACAALDGDARALQTALRTIPADKTTAPLRGLALLLTGRRLAATKLLGDAPRFQVYRAMAQKDGPGGMARARGTLAKRALGEDADSQSLFLAALAFWAADQKDRADDLLKRSVAAASSALDPALAPEPANGLPAAVEAAGGAKGDLRLAACLLKAGRVALALTVADTAPDGVDVWRLKMRAWRGIDDAEVARFASRVLRVEPEDIEAKVMELERLVKDGAFDRVEKLLETLTVEDHAGVERVRARVWIHKENGARALRVARRAARLDPKSDAAVALIVEALLLSGKSDQAAEFADELLRRKPADIDPYALIERVQKQRGRKRGLANEGMRSRLFAEGRTKRAKAVTRREAIFSAVRDAERAGRATGLSALADEDPTMALPVLLAVARHGPAGSARAARDKILAACGPNLGRLLERSAPWDRLRQTVDVYAKTTTVMFPLSAASPERCGRSTPLKARRRRR